MSSLALYVMAVAARQEMADALVAELQRQRAVYPDSGVLPPVLSVDAPRQGCWWNARKCWSMGAATDATHVLVVQDDAVLADDFVAGATNAVRARPHDAVSFYSARKEVPAARDAGKPWVALPGSSWLGALAVVLPRQMTAEFVAWADAAEVEQAKAWRYHDDTRLAAYLSATRRRMWVTAPSLVDHRNEPSQMGHPRTTGGRPRVAALFQAHGTRYIDWTTHEEQP